MISIAMSEAQSRGRRYAEPAHPYRSLYQRDRDRIVHSTAFRRLEYKTQVFVNHEGDFYRTRLTHTLEVAQIARTIACGLTLNENLTEAVALAHDLGHTPFGHAGERILNELLKNEGGFEHNLHGLRVVDLLETRYAEFMGINLAFETREAFTRHQSPAPNIAEFQKLGSALLEVQAAIIADDIAYDNHDLDDGLYSQILQLDDLAPLTLWQKACAKVTHKNLAPRLYRSCVIRNLIGILVDDVLENSQRNLVRYHIKNLVDVRNCTEQIINFSPTIIAEKRELEQFLHTNLYRNPHVNAMTAHAENRLTKLFAAYQKNPHCLPEKYHQRIENESASRIIADYLAGMTDRYAEQEYQRHCE